MDPKERETARSESKNKQIKYSELITKYLLESRNLFAPDGIYHGVGKLVELGIAPEGTPNMLEGKSLAELLVNHVNALSDEDLARSYFLMKNDSEVHMNSLIWITVTLALKNRGLIDGDD